MRHLNYRLLATLTAFDHAHRLGEALLVEAGLERLALRAAQCQVDLLHLRRSHEAAQGMDENRDTAEQRELLGGKLAGGGALGCRHARPQSCGGNNGDHVHGGRKYIGWGKQASNFGTSELRCRAKTTGRRKGRPQVAIRK